MRLVPLQKMSQRTLEPLLPFEDTVESRQSSLHLEGGLRQNPAMLVP